jgi:hypothetical protein
MQNHPTLPFPSVARISCEGKRYTLSPKTLAEGSAEYCVLTIGFCANNKFESNRAILNGNRHDLLYFITSD